MSAFVLLHVVGGLMFLVGGLTCKGKIFSAGGIVCQLGLALLVSYWTGILGLIVSLFQ